MEKFRRFEKFRVGNYVEHKGRLSKIEGIEKNNVYSLKDVVYDNIFKSYSPISGIRLNLELVKEFGFIETPRNNHLFFEKDELSLIEYAGYVRFCVYHPYVKSPADVEEYSCAIFYIHALQNFIEGNPHFTKVDFDDVINRLLKENYLFRSKFG